MDSERTRPGTARRHPLARGLGAVLAIAMLALGVTVAIDVTTAAPAQALCATPAMQGTWNNVDTATTSLVKAQMRFTCSDVVLCNADTGVCTGGDSYYETRPFGACSPTPCDWGWKRAYDMGSGWVMATYSYSWATKYVWTRTEVWYGLTYLRVWTSVDFTAADGRTDYTTNDWMLP